MPKLEINVDELIALCDKVRPPPVRDTHVLSGDDHVLIVDVDGQGVPMAFKKVDDSQEFLGYVKLFLSAGARVWPEHFTEQGLWDG